MFYGEGWVVPNLSGCVMRMQNGTLKDADGWQTVKFETSPIMSTYLVAVVIGEFDVIEAVGKAGVKLRVYTKPGESARYSQPLYACWLSVGLIAKLIDFFHAKHFFENKKRFYTPIWI